MIRTGLIGAAGLLLCAIPASAAVIADAPGDFLPSYTGAHGGDLDVLSTEVIFNNFTNTFTFTATLAAPVGTTPGASYVFGLDRGQGTARFVTGTPSIGAGVLFDLIVQLRPDGSGSINDLAGGGATPLPVGSATIFGNTITSPALAAALFPTRGFALENYTFNLWPRAGSGNAAISDFAPDASNAGLTVVPAPATAAALIGALALRRRRR